MKTKDPYIAALKLALSISNKLRVHMQKSRRIEHVYPSGLVQVNQEGCTCFNGIACEKYGVLMNLYVQQIEIIEKLETPDR